MTDETRPVDDEEPTSSIWLSVVEHDHSQPGGYRPILEDHIARVAVEPRATDEDGNPMPMVMVWLYTPGDTHGVMIGIDHAEALELADRIRTAAESLPDPVEEDSDA